ncbi:hypothetical protein BDI4_380041 [Burkholderia diffusa]|nr:hypothetical protein BDI4_380041 [Burkholderia diffusa]
MSPHRSERTRRRAWHAPCVHAEGAGQPSRRSIKYFEKSASGTPVRRFFGAGRIGGHNENKHHDLDRGVAGDEERRGNDRTAADPLRKPGIPASIRARSEPADACTRTTAPYRLSLHRHARLRTADDGRHGETRALSGPLHLA